MVLSLTPKREFFERFDSLQIREILVSLSTLHQIPLKYEYIGRGAEFWARVAEEREEKGGINAVEKEVWKLGGQILAHEMGDLDFVHVVDIGCGTGKPAFLAMDVLEREGVSFDYTAVDISREMARIATKNVHERYGVDTDAVIVDLENNALPIAFGWKEPTLFLFLGSTIVNFDWPVVVMDRIRRHMLEHDVLAMSTVLARSFSLREIEEEVKFYTSRASEQFVTYIPRLFNLPFRYETHWSGQERRFENYIVLEEDVLLDVDGYMVRLNKGDKVLVGFSRRYTFDEVTTMVHKVRFLTEHVVTSRDRRYMLGFYTVRKEVRP